MEQASPGLLYRLVAELASPEASQFNSISFGVGWISHAPLTFRTPDLGFQCNAVIKLLNHIKISK
jgi:hypothetical protein